MYGGSSKLGRAGGAGRGAGAKRLSTSFPLPPPHRPSGRSMAGSGGGSATNPRNRSSGATTSAAPQALEESFNLVSGNNPLAFAMIIRLVPDLVDEIKRVESQGGTARIKFDTNANNSSGNVINVGGKEFRFTWSREFGDLCDIYEERRSGEDGNGLLVESGSAWRKLNVQRVLDELTKNHVKMMSEEAERKSKSRKAIVLEPGNPSMKSQLKQLAAVETNPWKTQFKHKKESSFKKHQKVEPPQVGGPPKSAFRPGFSSVTAVKGRSSSPLPSPPEQSANAREDVRPIQATKDYAAPVNAKHIPVRSTSSRETLGHKGNVGAPVDLQSMLVTLLAENPKGMSLKALEKAVGDKIPNAVKRIEPIIKKVATLQAPGRYFLKPGVESEGSKKASSESGRMSISPEDNHSHEQSPLPQPCFEEKVADKLKDQTHFNSEPVKESNAPQITNNHRHSPDLVGNKKGSENSGVQAVSSSDSGSDTDSESNSSDSGSDSGSHSRSRSKSPAGSGSESSGDSESDASFNSKQGSDEDVDIMTSDDEKEPKPILEASVPEFGTSFIPCRTSDARVGQGENHEKEDGLDSDAVDIEKDTSDDERETKSVAVLSLIPEVGEKPVEKTKSFSPDPGELQARQNFIGSLFDERENTVKDSYRNEQSDSSERISGVKSKRDSNLEHFGEKSDRTKRFKAESLAAPLVPGGWDFQLQGSHNLSPNRIMDTFKDPTSQVSQKIDKAGNADLGLQKLYKETNSAGRRTFDQNGRTKAPDNADRPDKGSESLGHWRNNIEKGFPPQKEKFLGDTQNEENYMNEIKVPRNSKEGGARGKMSDSFDSSHQRQGERVGKLKESGQVSSSVLGFSPKFEDRIALERPGVTNGKSGKLQRELSDLELGELREPVSEDIPAKKKVERKSSFKRSENKANASDNWSSDLGKGKPIKTPSLELGRRSPLNETSRFPNNLEGSNKKRYAEDSVDDLTRYNHRAVQSQLQHTSRVGQSEVGFQNDKLADANTAKSTQNEVGVSQGIGLEGYGESNKKATLSTPQQHGSGRGADFHSVKESRRQVSHPIGEVTDRQKDSILAEGNNSDPKRRDSSSDENSCSYSKYEKDEPEFKGPIKDFSQYKDYVQEYRDKYYSYCSLNKILESYRNEFHKLGKDLESAKGQDTERYFYLLEQLKQSYHRCGKRHKRLKKIFVVLHEELKHLKLRIKDFAFSYSKD